VKFVTALFFFRTLGFRLISRTGFDVQISSLHPYLKLMPAVFRNSSGRVGQQIALAEFFKDFQKDSIKVPVRFDVEVPS
jgi:hypothetical protein